MGSAAHKAAGMDPVVVGVEPTPNRRARPRPEADHRARLRLVTPAASTVGELATSWVQATRTDASAHEIASFVRVHVEPWARELPVAAITPTEVAAWEDARVADGYSVSRLLTCRWLWRRLMAHGGVKLDLSGLPKLRRPRVSARRSEVLSPRDVALLVASQRGAIHVRALVVGLVLTGLRIGELIALRRSDVLEGEQLLEHLGQSARGGAAGDLMPAIRVERQWRTRTRTEAAPKDRASRLIPVHAALGRVLTMVERVYRPSELVPSAPLFPFLSARWAGAPRRWNQRTALRLWSEHLETHGLRARTEHSARHTFASIAEHYSRDPIAVHAITHPTSIAAVLRADRSSFGSYHHVFYERMAGAVASIRLPLVEATLDAQLSLDLEDSCNNT